MTEGDILKIKSNFSKAILDKILKSLIKKKLKNGEVEVYVQDFEISHNEVNKKYMGTVQLDFVVDEEAIKNLIWKT